MIGSNSALSENPGRTFDMISRKRLLFAIAIAIGLAMNVMPPLSSPAVALETPIDPNSPALAPLKTFWTAVVAGTPEALAPVLAPEYQVVRADGSGYAKEGYLKSALPKVAAVPEFTEVSVTGSGDLLVVRYHVTIDSIRDGKTVQAHAPRLTIFRKQGDAWLAVAHANFAVLEK
jgi:hypothetical protein